MNPKLANAMTNLVVRVLAHGRERVRECSSVQLVQAIAVHERVCNNNNLLLAKHVLHLASSCITVGVHTQTAWIIE